MRTALEIFLLLLGFALLIKGADVFVNASVGIARRLGIPSVVIGLTIVAIGTSAPEIVVSVSAAIGGSSAMAIGNVIGSNLFNLVFIVGLCALIAPISVLFKEIARDFWVSVVATAALLSMIIIFNYSIPRVLSALLLVGFIAYMFVLVRQALKGKKPKANDENPAPEADKPLSRSIFFAVFGAALVGAGGQVTVTNAVSIAMALGISERVTGLTILAIGTSLPELVTSVVACRKGENGIAIGNVVGSNIFNIMLVLGLTGTITALTVDGNLIFDIAVLIFGSLLFLLFALTGKKIARAEGFSLVFLYVLYMVWIIFR